MKTGRKLYHLLRPDERRAAVMLLGLMLIGMALETLSVGMVIPGLALMSEADLPARYPALAPWLKRLGNPSQGSLVVAGMLCLFGVYALKTAFLALLAWQQARFVYGFQAGLSQRLFTGYLRQPYAFHLQRNSAQLIRNTIGQVGDLSSALHQGLSLTTELMVVLGVSVLLLSVEPLGAVLVVSILGFAGWGFYAVTRSHLLRWGKARLVHEGLRIQRLQEGLGGAKDVKILGRETDFLAQYQLHNDRSARLLQNVSALSQLPRLWLELLAVCGLAVLVISMIARGNSLDSLVPTLGLFAAAAFRLMPSVNRVMGAVQNLRFSVPVIDLLESEVRLVESTRHAPSEGALPFKHALTLKDVSFQYEGADSPSVRSVSLTIAQGASVGFVGGSGAGKSTLVDVILGLLTPVHGTVEVDGIDIQKRLRSWQDQIGYVPQSVFLTDDTLRRNIGFGLAADQIDDAAVWHAIDAAQLTEFVRALPLGLETLVGERGVRISGGQRQRIGIARALYHDPPVLVLDEATSALDNATERGVMDAVRALQGKKTVLVVAHRLTTVEHCDRLYRLEDGRLVSDAQVPEAAPAARSM